MQRISFNFRQTDSTAELNAHFSGLVPYGVRNGFALSPDPDSPYAIKLAPGSLLTREGVLITETSEITISINTPDVTNPQTLRVDAVVAKYAYETVSPPRLCEYLLVAGTETPIASVTSLEALVPQALDTDMYVIGYLVRQNRSIDETSFFYYKRKSSDPDELTATFKTVGHGISLNGSDIVVAGGLSTINGYNTTTQSSAILAKTASLLTAAVNTNTEQVLDFPGLGSDRVSTPIYARHTDTAFDWSTITGLTVKYYKTRQDRIDGVITTALFNSPVLAQSPYDESTGTVQLPIGLCYGLYSVLFVSATAQTISVLIDDVQPVLIYNPGATGKAVAVSAVEIRDSIIRLSNGGVIPRKSAALVGYVTGSGDIVIARQNINKTVLSKPNVAGITPVFHFHGSLDYSIVAVDNLINELYYNNDMLDTVGARRIFKTPDVALIFTTGSGDPSLTTEFILLKT